LLFFFTPPPGGRGLGGGITMLAYKPDKDTPSPDPLPMGEGDAMAAAGMTKSGVCGMKNA